jgi:hypothetical protein
MSWLNSGLTGFLHFFQAGVYYNGRSFSSYAVFGGGSVSFEFSLQAADFDSQAQA